MCVSPKHVSKERAKYDENFQILLVLLARLFEMDLGFTHISVEAVYAPNISHYRSWLLNCIFDRADCSRVRANAIFRPDLGEVCMSFGKQVRGGRIRRRLTRRL
jgi:hypothetical protein